MSRPQLVSYPHLANCAPRGPLAGLHNAPAAGLVAYPMPTPLQKLADSQGQLQAAESEPEPSLPTYPQHHQQQQQPSATEQS